ncbi:hypothetical protein M405DRAFT_917191 [Rhizopogon salebrosus TDB-379]|nr:hypothetical protein M405DRAFT_917191 [Rhizopogon salebrosus TDB-379]
MSLSRWLSPAVAREGLYEDLFRVLAPGVPVYYAEYTLDNPEKRKVVAIADSRPKMREIFICELDRILVFNNTWQYLLKASAETIQTIGKRFVDAVIVAVHDYMHYEVVYAFAAQGYHILSEKPMVTSLRHRLDTEKAVKNTSIIFGTSHGHYSKALTEVVRSGQLGDLINAVRIEHRPVGYFHCSVLRSWQWRKKSESSFSLMTKSCSKPYFVAHEIVTDWTHK